MNLDYAAAFFVLFVILSMVLIQYWIIPAYVAKQNQTLAVHWTLIAGNSILILYNIYRMNPVGASVSGFMIGQNAPYLGGKRK